MKVSVSLGVGLSKPTEVKALISDTNVLAARKDEHFINFITSLNKVMKHSTEALILFCGISFMLGVIYTILLLTFS